MGPKVVSSNSTHRDSYPSIYKGNHWDNYSSSCLSVCHCPSLQYLVLTPLGILHLALKFSIPSLESTKLLNLPISRKGWENQKDWEKRVGPRKRKL